MGWPVRAVQAGRPRRCGSAGGDLVRRRDTTLALGGAPAHRRPDGADGCKLRLLCGRGSWALKWLNRRRCTGPAAPAPHCLAQRLFLCLPSRFCLVQAQNGLYLEGGTAAGSGNMMPAHRGMFTDSAGGVAKASALPAGSTALSPAAPSVVAPASVSPAEQAARASEAKNSLKSCM